MPAVIILRTVEVGVDICTCVDSAGMACIIEISLAILFVICPMKREINTKVDNRFEKAE